MAESREGLDPGVVAMEAFHGRRYPEFEAPGCTPPLWAAAADAMVAALRADPAISDDALARIGHESFFSHAPAVGRFTQDTQWKRAARAVRSGPFRP